MDVFQFRDQVVGDYASYVRSFLRISDPGIEHFVSTELERGRLGRRFAASTTAIWMSRSGAASTRDCSNSSRS